MRVDCTVFTFSCNLPFSTQQVYDWHARPGAIFRLVPPFEPVQVSTEAPAIANGSRAVLKLGYGPFKITWTAEHFDVQPGRSFGDRQISGPFAFWEHHHEFSPREDGGCTLTDKIKYKLPLHFITGRVLASSVKSQLTRMFRYRHNITECDISAHAEYGKSPLKVAVTGASGLVGGALVPFLRGGGHEVTSISRSANEQTDIRWDPERGIFDPSKLSSFDGVVHLAGESIADGRWSEAKKRRILDSRVKGTQLLVSRLLSLPEPPKVVVCASAVGWYGNCGDTIVDEEQSRGGGFLADVTEQWEAATQPLKDQGVRVVNLRIGTVLHPSGGALQKMFLPFKLGLGGPIGPGTQWLSWITLPDLLRVIYLSLTDKKLSGPINAVAPEPVTSQRFATALGAALHRPARLKFPEQVAKFMFGELAEEVLLSSIRAVPNKLNEHGFQFLLPKLDEGLAFLYGEPLLNWS